MILRICTPDGTVIATDEIATGETIEEAVVRTYRKLDPTIVSAIRLEERKEGDKHTGWFDCTLEVESREKAPGTGATEPVEVVVYTNPRPDPDRGYPPITSPAE